MTVESVNFLTKGEGTDAVDDDVDADDDGDGEEDDDCSDE